MSTLRTFSISAFIFIAGMGADRAIKYLPALHTNQPRIAHVGILVSDMDSAIAEWRMLGFTDIQVSAPSNGIDRRYHDMPLDCTLKQAFIKSSPEIELLQPVCSSPNPWGSELKEHGMQLHHLAFFVPDANAALDKGKLTGMVEIAEGKWKDSKPGYGEYFYVRKPGDALIIEYLSHTKP